MAQQKTPFELRSDALHLAYQILLNNALSSAETSKGTNGVQHEAIRITTEDVIAEAEKLNDFISSRRNS